MMFKRAFHAGIAAGTTTQFDAVVEVPVHPVRR